MLKPIISLSFALFILATVACSPKDSEATDAASSSTGAVATTGGTSSSTDAATTTEATSSTTGGSTTTTTTTPGPEDPENCVEFCGPTKYECGDPRDGTDSGDPECAAGTHCERTFDKTGICACEVWVCKVDCDPNDPRDCSELFQKCDPDQGMCYYDECRSDDDCCDSDSGGDCDLECKHGLCEHGV